MVEGQRLLIPSPLCTEQLGNRTAPHTPTCCHTKLTPTRAPSPLSPDFPRAALKQCQRWQGSLGSLGHVFCLPWVTFNLIRTFLAPHKDSPGPRENETSSCSVRPHWPPQTPTPAPETPSILQGRGVPAQGWALCLSAALSFTTLPALPSFASQTPSSPAHLIWHPVEGWQSPSAPLLDSDEIQRSLNLQSIFVTCNKAEI